MVTDHGRNPIWRMEVLAGATSIPLKYTMIHSLTATVRPYRRDADIGFPWSRRQQRRWSKPKDRLPVPSVLTEASARELNNGFSRKTLGRIVIGVVAHVADLADPDTIDGVVGAAIDADHCARQVADVPASSSELLGYRRVRRGTPRRILQCGYPEAEFFPLRRPEIATTLRAKCWRDAEVTSEIAALLSRPAIRPTP